MDVLLDCISRARLSDRWHLVGVPRSAAERHLCATGHRLEFGCCLEEETSVLGERSVSDVPTYGLSSPDARSLGAA
jgi:hypothetical protein